MPYDFFVDKRNAALHLRLFGDVTFEHRLAMLDEKLFLIARDDIRQITADFSQMIAANPIADDIYFAEIMQRHTHRMNGAASNLIFDETHPMLIAGLSKLQDAGRPIQAFRKGARRGAPRAPGRKILIPSSPIITTPPAMGRTHDIVADRRADTLYVYLFCTLTFQDRITAHDEMLFHVLRNDHRRVIIDLTQMTSLNTVQDELYFIDYLMHSPYMFRNQILTVIHSSEHSATRYTTAALKGIGLAIHDVEWPAALHPVL